MDGTISDRKQLTENAVVHRQPVQLSENGGDVITFSLPRHDSSSCVRYGLCACNLVICVCGKYNHNTVAMPPLDLWSWQYNHNTVAIALPGYNLRLAVSGYLF